MVIKLSAMVMAHNLTGSVSLTTLGQMYAHSTQVNAIRPNNNDANYTIQGTINWGNNPTSHDPDFTHMNAWGQVAFGQGLTSTPDTLVEIRNLQLWLLDGTVWRKLIDDDRMAAVLVDDAFDDYEGKPARHFSYNNNSILVQMEPGFVIHFYPITARQPITSYNLQAVMAVFDIRLVSASGADISGEVGKIIVSTGADYWISATAPDLGANVNNGDSFIGSYIVVEDTWRKVYGTTASQAQLAAHRPPKELEQLTGPKDYIGLNPVIVGDLGSVSGAFVRNVFEGLPMRWFIQTSTLLSWQVVGVGTDNGNGLEYFDLEVVAGDSNQRTISIVIGGFWNLDTFDGDVVHMSSYPEVLTGAGSSIGYYYNLNKSGVATQTGSNQAPVDGTERAADFIVAGDYDSNIALVMVFPTNQTTQVRIARPVVTFTDNSNLFIPGSTVDASTAPSTTNETVPGTVVLDYAGSGTCRRGFSVATQIGTSYRFRFRRLSGVGLYRVGTTLGGNNLVADTNYTTATGYWESTFTATTTTTYFRWFGNNVDVVISEISVRKVTP